MKFRAPRGTVDILPGEVERWRYLEDKARDLCRRYHFSEVRTPIFEYTELFQRGVGETTDIVQKEMYTFTDRAGRSLTLRPEGTAPVVRAFVENKVYAEPQPTKWFYIGPMFRYERPQTGRMRQFHQFGVEVFGTRDPILDAEIIALGRDYFEEIGLTGVTAEVNSVGCPVCRPVHREKLVAHLLPLKEKLCEDCQSRLDRNPLRVLDCKNPVCREVTADVPKITDFLCDDCGPHFEAVKDALDLLGVDYRVNPRLVRGLDYYTQTSFEYVLEGLGAQAGTLGGGGRYNGLVEEIGGGDVPGIGFALGLDRILVAMKDRGVQIPVAHRLDCYIVTLGGEAKRRAISLLAELRRAGCSVERDVLDRKMKGQMKAADRAQARCVVILGEEELNREAAVVKEMATGRQEEIRLDRLADYIRAGSKR